MQSLQFLTSLFGETEGPCHKTIAEIKNKKIFLNMLNMHKEPEYAEELKI